MFYYTVLVFSLMTFLRDFHVSSCDYSCADKPEFTPSSLVVKFGDPASASCTVCQHGCLGNDTIYTIETPVGKQTKNGTTLSWKVDGLIEWLTSPMCYYTDDTTGEQCCTDLPVTVYQPPDNVSISFVNHIGPLSEGDEYDLQCAVKGVAPAENLTVTFYKGQTVLDQQRSKRTEQKPVTEIFTLSINMTKEDDGVEFWCEAKLELGPEGPQPPPMVKSENIPVTVHYQPQIESSLPDVITVTEGNPLHLNCSAVGNPRPLYKWTHLPANLLPFSSEVLTIDSVTSADEGQYTCFVSNIMGEDIVVFNVVVKADYTLIIIGVIVGVFLLVLILGIVGFIRCYKHNRMGKYNLKAVFCMNSRHSAVPTME